MTSAIPQEDIDKKFKALKTSKISQIYKLDPYLRELRALFGDSRGNIDMRYIFSGSLAENNLKLTKDSEGSDIFCLIFSQPELFFKDKIKLLNNILALFKGSLIEYFCLLFRSNAFAKIVDECIGKEIFKEKILMKKVLRCFLN